MCTIFFPLHDFSNSKLPPELIKLYSTSLRIVVTVVNGCRTLKLRLHCISIQAVLLSAFINIQDLYSIHNLCKISAQNRIPVPLICIVLRAVVLASSLISVINTIVSVEPFLVCTVLQYTRSIDDIYAYLPFFNVKA